MANKKKLATSVAAVATAAAVLLGGTFAWQSISQTALNEASDVVNPGGRLHDDFIYTEELKNKDVYVENFADEDIFARVRLDEYFEITMNKGAGDAEKTEVIVGVEKDDPTTYVTHQFDEKNVTDDYWEWTTGGSAKYLPTFNLNKDSLQADINGTYTYVDPDTGENVPYGDYVDYQSYEVDYEVSGSEIYDADANNIDEENPVEGTNIKTVSDISHAIAETLDATFMSMDEWMNDYGAQSGAYWVYDTDGWVYWAQAIKPHTATGLLLDNIQLTEVMDDSWYYAINVVGQFVTADDLGDGSDENPGFMKDGMTDNAKALLNAIGVENVYGGGTDDGNGDDVIEPDYTVELVPNPVDKAPVIPLNSSIALSVDVEMTNPVLDAERYTSYSQGGFSILEDGDGQYADISGDILAQSTSGPVKMELGTDYTYDNGMMTVINEGFVGCVVYVGMSDGPSGEGVTMYMYAFYVGEEASGGEEPAEGLTIKADGGYTVDIYEDDVERLDIDYSIRREVGDADAFYLTSGADLTDASYSVYSATVEWNEDDSGTLTWNADASEDISVSEDGCLTLNTTASKYYKIVATYSDGTEDEVSVAFYKDYLEVEGISEELDEKVTKADFSITLSGDAVALMDEEDFEVVVSLYSGALTTGVTVSGPTIEGTTYTWTLNFSEEAVRNTVYKLNVIPPAALADYYGTSNVQFVVGVED